MNEERAQAKGYGEGFWVYLLEVAEVERWIVPARDEKRQYKRYLRRDSNAQAPYLRYSLSFASSAVLTTVAGACVISLFSPCFPCTSLPMANFWMRVLGRRPFSYTDRPERGQEAVPQEAQDELYVAVGDILGRDVHDAQALALQHGEDHVEIVDGLDAVLRAARVRQRGILRLRGRIAVRRASINTRACKAHTAARSSTRFQSAMPSRKSLPMSFTEIFRFDRRIFAHRPKL